MKVLDVMLVTLVGILVGLAIFSVTLELFFWFAKKFNYDR